MLPRLKLVDGSLELLTAAVARGAALGPLLGVSVADDWAGFPEALPVVRASYEKDPAGHEWGSLFFVDPQTRTLVGLGGTPTRGWFGTGARVRPVDEPRRSHC